MQYSYDGDVFSFDRRLRLCGESVNAKDCKGWEFPAKEANKIIANDNNFAHGNYALAA